MTGWEAGHGAAIAIRGGLGRGEPGAPPRTPSGSRRHGGTRRWRRARVDSDDSQVGFRERDGGGDGMALGESSGERRPGSAPHHPVVLIGHQPCGVLLLGHDIVLLLFRVICAPAVAGARGLQLAVERVDQILHFA